MNKARMQRAFFKTGPIARQNQQLFASDWMAAVNEDLSAILRQPLAVGFGIGSPEAAVEAAAHADAVIVGSAVVKQLLAGKLDEAAQLIADMRAALDKSY